MKLNKTNRKVIAFLLVILLALGTAPAVYADEVTSPEPTTGIIYRGKSVVDKWLYQNIDTTYTTTDLFKKPGFKNIMPGDRLTQDFIIKNETGNRVKLFMNVVAHDDVNNKLSDSVAAKTTTERMCNLLNQMKLEVKAGAGDNARTLFVIPEGQLGTFTSEESIMLGTLTAYHGAILHVDLTVPIEMDNEFANEIGEIDFKFTIEEYSSGGGGGTTPEEPEIVIPDPEVPKDEPKEPVVIPGEPVEDIPDPEKPLGDAPKTGDTTNVVPFVILMIVALFGLRASRKIS